MDDASAPVLRHPLGICAVGRSSIDTSVNREAGDDRSVRTGKPVPLLALLMRCHFSHLGRKDRGCIRNALKYWYERNLLILRRYWDRGQWPCCIGLPLGADPTLRAPMLSTTKSTVALPAFSNCSVALT